MNTLDFWLPALVPLTSLLAGIIIFLLGEERVVLRRIINLGTALIKLALVGSLLWGVYRGHFYEFRVPLFGAYAFVFHADPLSMLFVALSSSLWLITTVYAIGYLEGSTNRRRFFGFFSFCVSATTAVALAGNPLTFLIGYEFLTLSTYPLVIHRGTPAALRAGRMYLAYTISGGMILFFAIVWLQNLGGPVPFAERGTLQPLAATHRDSLVAIFFLMVLGLGVKAALVPLHRWLPAAMVAPAPVSALLHAVAVVKAGAFGLIRTVYDLYGIDLCVTLGVLPPLALAAAATILYGSLRALFQDDLKRRLAYSTVSQVSYIILGVATIGMVSTTGGIVHLVHQGLMKITLFFCAGNLAERLHIHRVSEMDGVGRQMPLTLAAFSLCALGMIGVPPMAGFISKWHIGLGAIQSGTLWVIPVLVVSSLLNAGYFLPILYRAWFKSSPEPLHPLPAPAPAGPEIKLTLLVPPLVTALLALLSGLLAGSPFSPLFWARVITFREYGL